MFTLCDQAGRPTVFWERVAMTAGGAQVRSPYVFPIGYLPSLIPHFESLPYDPFDPEAASAGILKLYVSLRFAFFLLSSA